MQKSIFSFSDFIKNFPTPSKFREKEKQMAASYTAGDQRPGNDYRNMAHTKENHAAYKRNQQHKLSGHHS